MLTLLACGQGQSGTYVELILQAYKLRVYAEAGVFEAEDCLKESLKGLDSIQFTPITGILINYPGAAVAYSLISLDSSITNVIKIRRSSDNTESNFTAVQITDGTLLTFCGSGSGFVTTWYDQSRNNAHVTQTTASNQPVLVSSGVINLQNGKPAIAFNGTSSSLSFSGEVLNKNSFLAFAVVKNNKTASSGRIFDQSNVNGGGLFYDQSINSDTIFGVTNSGNSNVDVSPLTTGYSLQVGQILSGKSKLRTNGVTRGTNTNTFTMSGNTGIPFIIGENSPSTGFQNFGGNLQALIIYTTDQDSNIAVIETEINNFYNIY
jgi:hypothetical protein